MSDLGVPTCTTPSPSILRRRDVQARTGLSRSSIYLRLSSGEFPKPVRLGPRAVGWLAHEIDEWIRARVEARDSAEAVS